MTGASPADSDGRRLLQAGRLVASGTVASRATGFARLLVLAAVLGTGTRLFDAYSVANTVPNIVFDLLIGGILTSLAVPFLVRAMLRDPSTGDAYAGRVLGLVVYGLGAAVVISIVAAPLLVDLYAAGFTPAEHHLAVVLTRFFLPQVLFYGLGATMAAIINARGRFGLPAWAPVINNLVVITAGLLYVIVGGRGSVAAITPAEQLILGLGTTLGIVAQTVVLAPALRRCGIRWRQTLLARALPDRGQLQRAARVAGWVSLYVLANQAMLVVVTRVATSSGPGGIGVFTNAYTVFQVPYAIVAVSVMTTLLPRMSAHGVHRNDGQMTIELSRAFRLAGCVLVPTTVAFVLLGPSLATLLFAHGRATSQGVHLTGSVLMVFGLAILPFSAFQVTVATFYALRDTRTPALVNVVADLLAVAVVLVSAAFLPAQDRDLGVALAYLVSYGMGLVLLVSLLRHRLGRVDGHRVLRTYVRLLIAGLIAGAFALGVRELMSLGVGDRWPGALAIVIAVSLTGALVFLAAAGHMRVRELHILVARTGGDRRMTTPSPSRREERA